MPSRQVRSGVRGVAFVPGSPLLLPGLGGRADALADLRGQCRKAVTALGAGPLVVLGAGRTSGGYDPAAPLPGWAPRSVAPRAGGQSAHTGARSDHHAGVGPLPAALAVGAWLAGADSGAVGDVAAVAAGGGDVVVVAVGDDAVPQLPADVGLVVVGDGSACRGPRAPLPDDPRAEAYDRAVEAALASGDPAALLGLDPYLGAELGVSGLVAWSAAARLAAPGPWRAQVLRAEAPLGVAYTVAIWLPKI